jgi:cysteinyl-tRNA synthetase
MEYSEDAVQAARNGLEHLRNQVRSLKKKASNEPASVNDGYRKKFMKELNDDLNMPRALASVQEALKSNMDDSEKLATILDFDRVLGLDLKKVTVSEELPEDIQRKITERKAARAEKDWALSDQLRDEIQALGYVVQDAKDGMTVFKK